MSEANRPPDGLLLLGSLREAIQAQFVGLGPEPPAETVRLLLLALELRCKLEELLLFPALYEGLGRRVTAGLERDIGSLREIAAQARAAAGDRERQRTLLVALEGASLLHFDAVERLAGEHAAALDRTALGTQAAGMLQRWRGELRRDGDVEDEEDDPVGQPPR